MALIHVKSVDETELTRAMPKNILYTYIIKKLLLLIQVVLYNPNFITTL